jgi:hypothetical protein
MSPNGEKMACLDSSGRHDGNSSALSAYTIGMEFADVFPNQDHRYISILASIAVRSNF